MNKDIAHFDMVKMNNKKKVRNTLMSGEEMGVTNLAVETGLSYPTVSNIIRELLEEGEVVECKETRCKGGRPAVFYKLSKDYRYGLLMILEVKGIDYVVVDAYCKEVERGNIGNLSMNTTKSDFVEVIKPLKAKYPNIKTAALGIPGVAIEGDIRFLDFCPNLQGDELYSMMKEELNIDLYVENDSNAMALAQINGNESFANILYLRKCVGVGLVINGQLFRGVNGYAGELDNICERSSDPSTAMTDIIKKLNGVLDIGKIYIFSDCEIDLERVHNGLVKYFDEARLPEMFINRNKDEIYLYGLAERLLMIWREEIG